MDVHCAMSFNKHIFENEHGFKDQLRVGMGGLIVGVNMFII